MNEELNPYRDNEGKKKLQNSIVVFIDILGFKDRVRDSKTKGKSENLFSEFNDVVLLAFEKLNEEIVSHKSMKDEGFTFMGNKSPYVFHIFTDCFIIACPIKEIKFSTEIYGSDEFYKILSMLPRLQLELVNRDFFIRGAIAVDEFYMDEHVIYGVAGLDAYEAETKLAKYPRIILMESAKNTVEAINEAFMDQGRPKELDMFLEKDKNDDEIFVNYLETSIRVDYEEWDIEGLEAHKKSINDNLIKNKGNEKNYKKYKWTADYHNNFCKKHDSYADYVIDFHVAFFPTVTEEIIHNLADLPIDR